MIGQTVHVIAFEDAVKVVLVFSIQVWLLKFTHFSRNFASKIFDSPDLINSDTSVNYALDISFIVAFKTLTLLNYAIFT